MKLLKAVEAGNLEKLLSIAATKDDLIAIVSKSNDLRGWIMGNTTKHIQGTNL